MDTDEIQVIRAADLYLAQVGDRIHVVGVDVSLQTLLRRLGPWRFRWHPTPDRVIDWAAIESFGEDSAESPSAVKLRTPHDALRKLRPAELADVLEGLGRRDRQELIESLGHDLAADALEEMEPQELTALLREVEPDQAAELIARMEPDEAVDALRDLSDDEQGVLLARMPQQVQRELVRLLGYPGDEAAGIMTTVLACASPDETVAQVSQRLAEQALHRTEIDSVAVLDEDGRLLGDISAFDLLVSDGARRLGDLIDPDQHADDRCGPRTTWTRWPPNWSSRAARRCWWWTTTAARWAASCPTTCSTPWCPGTGGCTSRGCCSEQPGDRHEHRRRIPRRRWTRRAPGARRDDLADPGPGGRGPADPVPAAAGSG